jgi:hypothetical protein
MLGADPSNAIAGLLSVKRRPQTQIHHMPKFRENESYTGLSFRTPSGFFATRPVHCHRTEDTEGIRAQQWRTFMKKEKCATAPELRQKF